MFVIKFYFQSQMNFDEHNVASVVLVIVISMCCNLFLARVVLTAFVCINEIIQNLIVVLFLHQSCSWAHQLTMMSISQCIGFLYLLHKLLEYYRLGQQWKSINSLPQSVLHKCIMPKLSSYFECWVVCCFSLGQLDQHFEYAGPAAWGSLISTLNMFYIISNTKHYENNLKWYLHTRQHPAIDCKTLSSAKYSQETATRIA